MTKAKGRHQWGAPQYYLHKTERVCLACGMVKVTRHEVEGPRDLHWQEFWRGLDQIVTDKTPPCAGHPSTPAGGLPADHGDVKHELPHQS